MMRPSGLVRVASILPPGNLNSASALPAGSRRTVTVRAEELTQTSGSAARSSAGSLVRERGAGRPLHEMAPLRRSSAGPIPPAPTRARRRAMRRQAAEAPAGLAAVAPGAGLRQQRRPQPLARLLLGLPRRLLLLQGVVLGLLGAVEVVQRLGALAVVNDGGDGAAGRQ